MTTNTTPLERTPRVLLAGVLAVLATTSVAAVVAAVGSDAGGVRGALVGGLTVLVFFAFGTVVVGTAAKLAPTTALLVAMITYTLQVLLVAMVFVGLRDAGAFDSALREGWVAATVIAGTFAWMTGQLVATVRTPIAPWVDPVSGEEVDAA